MPYTTTWDNNTPVDGVDPNNTEDNVVREIRLAIHQRMDDIVEDWAADPVVLPQFVDALRLVKRYVYNADAAPGSRAINPAYVRALLIVNYSGITNVSGNIVVDFNEFDEIYDMNDILLNFLVGAHQAPLFQALFQPAVNDFVFAYPISFDVGAKTITYSMRRQDGGLIGSGQFVAGDMFFLMENVPV